MHLKLSVGEVDDELDLADFLPGLIQGSLLRILLLQAGPGRFVAVGLRLRIALTAPALIAGGERDGKEGAD